MSNYQPPLMSLQDMLDLPGEDDNEDFWSENPFSISHYFEPPIPLTAGITDKSEVEQHTLGVDALSYSGVPAAVESQSQATGDQELIDVLNFFEENEVPREVEQGTAEKNSVPEKDQIPLPFRKRKENVNFNDLTGEPASTCSTSQKRETGPVLVEVNSKVRQTKRDKVRAEKCRQTAINQLDSLISTLKRYKNELESFLAKEGNIIMETYDAKQMLRNFLPEPNESAQESNPFYEAHSITKAVIGSATKTPPIFALPPRRPLIWRGRDLLLLQKSVLESVIARRVFFLNCRYTDLLTQMGFEDEDLQRLQSCETKQHELGLLKIILNEHDFFSQFKRTHSTKKSIERCVIMPPLKASGAPRVMLFPQPEALVEEKWTCLTQIRRTTTLSTIKDEEIDWLYVMKQMAQKGTHCKNVDEENCKLTFDQLLSFKYNNYHWDVNELKKLNEMRQMFPKASWYQIAGVMGTYRTPFSCFVKYKLFCYKKTSKTLQFSPAMLKTVKTMFENCDGNASQVDFLMTRVTKLMTSPARLMYLYRTSLNPRFRKGKFSAEENALLLVTLEMHKDKIFQDWALEKGKFSVIAYLLPWRPSVAWFAHFRTLFTNFHHARWTQKEDERLLELVQEYGPNWKRIEREFPLRDRKQCEGRARRLKNITNSWNLDLYHKTMMLQDKGTMRGLTKMEEVKKYLEVILFSKMQGNRKYILQTDLEFLKLRRQPTDRELECYLMTFPVNIFKQVLARVTECISRVKVRRNEFEGNKFVNKEDEEENRRRRIQETVRKLNRKCFIPDCPVSVASALSVLEAELVAKETFNDLTEFERSIYDAMDYFTVRASGRKKNVQRRMLPTLDEIRKLTSVSRLIAPAGDVLVSNTGPCLVVNIKPETPVKKSEEEKRLEEQALLDELARRKQGGRRMGVLHKKARNKLARQKAAMARWSKEKTSKDNVPDDDAGSEDWMFSDHGSGIPIVPGDENTCPDVKSVLRRALNGYYSDHTYCQPLVRFTESNPTTPSSMQQIKLEPVDSSIEQIHLE